MTRVEFDAVAQAPPRGGAFVPLPANAADIVGTRARFPVRVTFNGVPYRGSTMPMGDGTFCGRITKAIRVAAGADIGENVHVVLERDDEERSVEVPADLVDALHGAGLTARFEAIA